MIKYPENLRNITNASSFLHPNFSDLLVGLRQAGQLQQPLLQLLQIKPLPLQFGTSKRAPRGLQHASNCLLYTSPSPRDS